MPNFKKNISVIKVAIPSPLRTLFDYLPPKDCDPKSILPGMRVLVPFGNREVIGVVLGVVSESQFGSELKSAFSILDDGPLLSESMLKLADWISDYYHHPIGDVISNMLPKILQQETTVNYIDGYERTNNKTNSENKIELNQYQQQAVDNIIDHLNKFKVFLLHGITGSGKTEVYLRVIEEVIKSGKQALVLVPEINLTPQTIARFSDRFSVRTAIVHSRLTPKARLLAWQEAREGKAKIIIGTRSAIFVSLKNPGIIIVDEEHDLSFKQQTGLRYSARDLVVMRGKLENIPVVLGSATPSLESVYNVKNKKYQELKLPERVGNATHPDFYLIDMRSQKLRNGIAEGLLYQINKHLNNGGQVLVFLNRRGFAPVLICHHCGWNANCEYCDAKLTLHKGKNHLRCHHCGIVKKIPAECPDCARQELLMLGAGTERIEEALQELFPDKNIVRIDRDTTKQKNSLEDMLKSIHADEYQILVGTQMLAKGHHFPKVTMSAILNVDQSLFSSDFRASEHLAQLVMQVAGRAGRGEMPGEVYLQTHNPHHHLLLDLINFGYSGFVNNCFAERKVAELPPYSHLVLLQAESKKQDATFDFLNKINSSVQGKLKGTKILGPVPAAMERRAGYFRAQLLLQNNNRAHLQQDLSLIADLIGAIKPPSGLRWFLDVDPVDLGG